MGSAARRVGGAGRGGAAAMGSHCRWCVTHAALPLPGAGLGRAVPLCGAGGDVQKAAPVVSRPRLDRGLQYHCEARRSGGDSDVTLPWAGPSVTPSPSSTGVGLGGSLRVVIPGSRGPPGPLRVGVDSVGHKSSCHLGPTRTFIAPASPILHCARPPGIRDPQSSRGRKGKLMCT